MIGNRAAVSQYASTMWKMPGYAEQNASALALRQ
jgi:hypothetical protein